MEVFAPPRAPLPPGTKNYITKRGAEKIQRELEALLERKKAAAESDQRSIEARIQYLQALIRSLVAVEPSPSEVVRFGARLRVRRTGGEETYTIVGVDEIDLDQNHISWLSPLARALNGRHVGERIAFKSPGGTEQIEILTIE